MRGNGAYRLADTEAAAQNLARRDRKLGFATVLSLKAEGRGGGFLLLGLDTQEDAIRGGKNPYKASGSRIAPNRGTVQATRPPTIPTQAAKKSIETA
jgi:hypothetical protein